MTRECGDEGQKVSPNVKNHSVGSLNSSDGDCVPK